MVSAGYQAADMTHNLLVGGEIELEGILLSLIHILYLIIVPESVGGIGAGEEKAEDHKETEQEICSTKEYPEHGPAGAAPRSFLSN